MSQRRQKQSQRSPSKSINSKDVKKGGKKPFIVELSPQELLEKQILRVQQFFSSQFERINSRIDTSHVDQSIFTRIIEGEITVKQQAADLSAFIKPPTSQDPMKITSEQMEMYEKEARRIQHLKLISNLNKQLMNKQPQETIPYILTKEEHERKIREIIEEKRERQRHNSQMKQAMKENMEKQQKQAEERTKKQKSQEKEKKRIQIQQKITKQKQQHIHFMSSDIKHRKDIKELLTKVALHVKMQQSYKASIQLPQLEQKKKEYKQLRDIKNRYSVDHIREYEKEFNEKQKQRLQQSKIKKLAFSTASESRLSFLSKLPQKPQRLKRILAEQAHRLKGQWTQRNLYTQEKLKREENFQKKLKQQFKPKIDKAKQEQIERRIEKEKQHLAKVGLDIDKRKVGLEYLQEVKRMSKKKIQQKDTMGRSDQMTLRHRNNSQTLLSTMKRAMSSDNPLDMQKNNEFILKIREKRLQKILNSEEAPIKKLKMLEIQTQKIQQVKNQKIGLFKHNFSQIASKQASNMALNSIKVKMNLIELMKKQ